MVDVRGVGVLIRGKSGVGKSETALGLIERGAALVADDMVYAVSYTHLAQRNSAPDARWVPSASSPSVKLFPQRM